MVYRESSGEIVFGYRKRRSRTPQTALVTVADFTSKWQDDYQRLLQEFRELLSRHLAIAEDLVEEARPYRLA